MDGTENPHTHTRAHNFNFTMLIGHDLSSILGLAAFPLPQHTIEDNGCSVNAIYNNKQRVCMHMHMNSQPTYWVWISFGGHKCYLFRWYFLPWDQASYSSYFINPHRQSTWLFRYKSNSQEFNNFINALGCSGVFSLSLSLAPLLIWCSWFLILVSFFILTLHFCGILLADLQSVCLVQTLCLLSNSKLKTKNWEEEAKWSFWFAVRGIGQIKR